MANKACNEVVTVANMPMTVFDMISAMQNKYADRVAFRYVEGKDTVVEKTYAPVSYTHLTLPTIRLV